MTQETIEKIQPLVDEYTLCELKKQGIIRAIKNAYREMSSIESLQIKELIILQGYTEKKIMQILFEENKEKVETHVHR